MSPAYKTKNMGKQYNDDNLINTSQFMQEKKINSQEF